MTDATHPRQKISSYYTQLLETYNNLEAEIAKLTEEEKQLHQEILLSVDKKKIKKIQEHISNIKD